MVISGNLYGYYAIGLNQPFIEGSVTVDSDKTGSNLNINYSYYL